MKNILISTNVKTVIEDVEEVKYENNEEHRKFRKAFGKLALSLVELKRKSTNNLERVERNIDLLSWQMHEKLINMRNKLVLWLVLLTIYNVILTILLLCK